MFRFHDFFNRDAHEHDFEMGGHHPRRKHFANKMRGRGSFGHDFGGGGRKRHRRGDIKFILLELIKEQPRHGYELIKLLEEQYGGFYRPSPGTIYPTLQLLEDEGNLLSETVAGKRVYKITPAGEALLQQHRHDSGEARGSMRAAEPNWELRANLRHSAMALLDTLMQAGRYGSLEQVKAIQELLNKTNKTAHQILAGERPTDTV